MSRALAIAERMGLRPSRPTSGSKGSESRIRCPEGCCDADAAGQWGASLIVDGEREGVWVCFRDKSHTGNLLFDHADEDGEAASWTPTEAGSQAGASDVQPIDVQTAWRVITDARLRWRGEVNRWAKGRGWPDELAQAVSGSPHVGFAMSNSVGHADADRLADHARYAQRPLMVCVRSPAGVPISVIRRCVGQPPKEKDGKPGPKAKIAAKSLCPTGDDVRVLGDLPMAAHAAAQGRVVLVVEGEPDFLAADGLTRLPKGVKDTTEWDVPWAAVVGSGTSGDLPKLAVQLAQAILREPLTEKTKPVRVIFVPHLGDKNPDDVGETKMAVAQHELRRVLREKGRDHLTTQCHLPLDARGKTDLADVIERLGVEELLRQVREVVPSYVHAGGVTIEYAGGIYQREMDGTTAIASECWPVCRTRLIDDGTFGARYRYRRPDGLVQHGVLPASAWLDGRAGTGAAAAAADAGVAIRPGQGPAWVAALGQWALHDRSPLETTVRRSGWHHDPQTGWVYVGLRRVFGAPWLRVSQSPRECQPAGSLEGWKEGVKSLGLLQQPAMALALGVALAGPLLARLGRKPTLVHFSGGSSSGKTTATRVGASVWHSKLDSWGDTVTFTEQRLGLYGGACVVLDELGRMKPEAVAEFIHRFAAGEGRGRAKSSGVELREQAHWSLTGLSSGEVTISAHLGSLYQGGHGVRALDVPIQPGDATRDILHARACEQFVLEQHGHAGEAWAEYLAQLDSAGWDKIATRAAKASDQIREWMAGGAEDGRIADYLGLCWAALLTAQYAALFDRFEPERTFRWVVNNLGGEREREGRSPEDRALRTLARLWATDPQRFPLESVWSQAKGRIIGIAQENWIEMKDGKSVAERTDCAWITEAGLRACPEFTAGAASPRTFLGWCVDRGFAVGPQRKRIEGQQLRVYAFDFGQVDEFINPPKAAATPHERDD